MAGLTKAAVSLIGTPPASLSNQVHSRQEQLVYRRLKIVLTGQGSPTNSITAAALGFATLVDTSNWFDAIAGKTYAASVDTVNNIIVLCDPAGASTSTDLTTADARATILGTLHPSASLT